jgi:membrane carboxypeptidase/penicillin-binding protein
MPTRLVRHLLLGLFLLSLALPSSVIALVAVVKADANKKPAAVAHKAAPAVARASARPVAARQIAGKQLPRKPVQSAHLVASYRRPAAAVVRRTATRTGVAARPRPITRFNPWTEPSFGEPTVGDNEEGEDPVIRKAAVDALGPFNGTVVVVDPSNGRILSIVNQKLAFQNGHTPCSTVKLITSLAALKEGLIDRTTPVRIGRRLQMDMTEAIAISNNYYFSKLGTQMGFDKVNSYARLFGVGEKAGWEIEGEQAGSIEQLPAAAGGVGMMTSFGNGIHVTPLELAALVSAIANNGTLYYLQYPRTNEDISKLQPKVKRTLDIANLVPEIRPGMQGAVEYGTARRAGLDSTEQVLGKTGTCSEYTAPTTHLGWFGSFNDPAPGIGKRLVVVVMLTGGRQVNGPVASGVAGSFYRNLARMEYYARPAAGSVEVTTSGSGASH